MWKVNRSQRLGYAVAVLTVVLIVAARCIVMSRYLNLQHPYIGMAIPVLIAAWYIGWGGGLFATILGLLVANFFFIEPVYQFKLFHYGNISQLIFFLLMALIATWLGALVRHAAIKIESQSLLLNGILSASPNGFALTDSKGRYLYINTTAASLLHLTPAEMIGRTWQDLGLPAEVMEPIQFWRDKVLADGKEIIKDIPLPASFGSRDLEYHLTPLLCSDGTIEQVVTTIRDVTTQRQQENALRTEEHFKHAILNSLPAHIAVINKEGVIVAVNEAWEKFGEENEALAMARISLGANYFSVCSAAMDKSVPEAKEALEGIENVIQGRQSVFSLEYPCHSPTKHRWFQMIVHRLPEEIGGAVIAHVNITSLKQTEKALREVNDELESRVANRTAELEQANQRTARLLEQVITAQEEERKYIAHELHDETGQSLAALLVRLRAFENIQTLLEARERAVDLRQIVTQMLDDVRRMASGLRPSVLDDLGLLAALERYTDDYSKIHGINVEIDAEQLQPSRLASPMETAIYRIVQEALANVVKHANAKSVRISCQRQDDWVEVDIEDDGQGFDVKAIAQKQNNSQSLGLQSMRERAGLLGGTFAIASTPGQGTTIAVRIPCLPKILRPI